MKYWTFIFTAILWVTYVVLKIIHKVQAKKLDREFDEMIREMHEKAAKDGEEGVHS